MRTLFSGSFILISLVFLAPAWSVPAIAQEACRCQGCGCKGGPGWRGPNGYCVSTAKLTKLCGSPPGEPCKQEATARVCFTAETAPAEPKAGTEAP